MTVRLIEGDCLAAMARMARRGEIVQAVVTDPPYHLTSIVQRFGAANAAPAQQGTDGAFARAAAGFMGKQWDGGDIALRPATWRLAYDLLPPGGHLVAFGGTRTFHRMAVAIEDAGFEIRDTLMWLYGTGFPKSHNQNGEWQGWGTALKPAWEPIILARKPLAGTVAATVLAHGVGALNIDGCRVEADRPTGWGGGGSRLYEGGLSRTGGEARPVDGRWPANVLHDGSDEVEAAFAAYGEKTSGKPLGRMHIDPGRNVASGASKGGVYMHTGFGDSGSASRFFYSAKASAADRAGSKHPTVKPIALMRWLVRLACPPGGTILDPFAGSGTTGAAARAEGVRAVLMEREEEYQRDICRRLDLPWAGEEAA